MTSRYGVVAVTQQSPLSARSCHLHTERSNFEDAWISSAVSSNIGALWNGMHSAVTAGDQEKALSYLHGTAKAKYGPVFDALKADYASIVATFSTPARGALSAEMAEYAVTRPNGNAKQLFYIYYLKGGDGAWRLDEM